MQQGQPAQQHEVIAAHLHGQIHDGALKPGSLLPSEAELCRQFDSSRGPVRQALATLRSEGLITSGRGRRSRVLDSPGTESFESIISATTWLRQTGLTPGARTQYVTEHSATGEVAEQLELDDGEPIVTIRRVRTANEVPFLIEQQHFRMEAGRHLLDLDTDAHSVHEELKRQGISFHTVSRTLTALAPSEEEARLLESDISEPLLRLSMRCFTSAGVPMEYADYRYRADNVSMGMNSSSCTPSPLWVAVNV